MPVVAKSNFARVQTQMAAGPQEALERQSPSLVLEPGQFVVSLTFDDARANQVNAAALLDADQVIGGAVKPPVNGPPLHDAGTPPPTQLLANPSLETDSVFHWTGTVRAQTLLGHDVRKLTHTGSTRIPEVRLIPIG